MITFEEALRCFIKKLKRRLKLNRNKFNAPSSKRKLYYAKHVSWI